MNDTTRNARASGLSAAQVWDRAPKVWVFGAILAATGWLFTFGSSTITTVNGVTTCDGLDLGPFMVAPAIVLTVVAGLTSQRRSHPARRLPQSHQWTIVGVLLAAAAAYVAVGLINPAGSFC